MADWEADHLRSPHRAVAVTEVVVVLGLVWGWGFLGDTVWSVPRTTHFLVPWVVIGLGALLLGIDSARRAASRTFVTRWWTAIIGSTLLFVVASSLYAAPVGYTQVLLVLIATPLAFVLFLASFVGLRRKTLPSIVAMLSIAGLVALIFTDTSGVHDAGLRFRVRLVAPGLERDAARVLAAPVRPVEPPTHKAFTAVPTEGTGAVVAWSLVPGIPAHESGLTYDPITCSSAVRRSRAWATRSSGASTTATRSWRIGTGVGSPSQGRPDGGRMRRRLNRAQRVVIVIAWGAALYVGSNYVLAEVAAHQMNGWFNYAPNDHAAYSPNEGGFQFLSGFGLGVDPKAVLAIRLVGLALWVGGALWLLREPRDAR